jgi:hypothetical protein
VIVRFVILVEMLTISVKDEYEDTKGAVACPVVLFLLSIVLSVLLRYTDSDCPFGIFKLFLFNKAIEL